MENTIEITQAEYERLCKVETLYRYHLSMLRSIITQGEGTSRDPNNERGLDPDRALIETNPEAKAFPHVSN